MVSAAVALVIAQVATVLAAPHVQQFKHDSNASESSTPCQESGGDVYDQRQNGTENYWINVDGVVVLLAPAETILAAANLPNMETELKPPKPTTVRPLLLETNSTNSSGTLPTVHIPDNCAGGKCNLNNATVGQRGKLKMMNHLLQIFRNLKDDTQAMVN
ncbi:UNVERIFIED_CONTAM: hypothetical protein PYX00_005713 [Menopon gallinae]|uniref:Uncharacterized protein n=1 Tax=Menopon gallinae TaxID=328185 RepID=A0AAW2HSL9_9NEOP